MVLTITYKGEHPSDLGFLLHKNPKRPQEFSLSFGKAYVFYPEITQDCCTAALLLDIDPLDLARGKEGSRSGGLFDYVNDRPYVSSSFMSTAISRVFGTAMGGQCKEKQELADTPLCLEATVASLPCQGQKDMVAKVFEPLGYEVTYTTSVLDEKYPQWGQSDYIDLTLKGKVRLQDLLKHLYVLIPVFDKQKHYWIARDEVDKLLQKGEGWLENHPLKEFITNRYMVKRRGLARLALDRLDNGESGVSEEVQSDEEQTPSLNTKRLQAVVEQVLASGAKSVIDLGCGEGNLLALLIKQKRLQQITGTDVSSLALKKAAKRLKLDHMPEREQNKIQLFQSSLTYRDKRFMGFDCACVVEVIEHLDQNRLNTFERVLFVEAKPQTVVLTTPNREFNDNYENLQSGNFRHGDHRFEWTRKEFESWGNRVAKEYGYTVEYKGIGEMDKLTGTPTQMGVFTKCE